MSFLHKKKKKKKSLSVAVRGILVSLITHILLQN